MNEVVDNCLVGLNSIGGVFCGYAAGIFVQSALLIAVLAIVDLLLRKRVRAVVRYCVWLLVLVKLLLPPTLCLPTGIGYWFGSGLPAPSFVAEYVPGDIAYDSPPEHFPQEPQPSSGIAPVPSASRATQMELPAESAERAAARLTPITWQAILLLLWLAGMLGFGALLAQRLRFVRGMAAVSLPAGPDLSDVLQHCLRQVGIRRDIEVRTSDTISSPAVCGLVRPRVLIPSALVKDLPPDGLQAILIHELAHIKRGDLWVTSVQTVLQVIHFYNPFVWLANAMIRRVREEAVDETVLVTLGGQAKDYSNTLISIGEMAFWKADFGLRLIGVAESKQALKRRIKHMLTRPVPQTARIGALGTITILLIAAVLLPMARAERAGQEASTPPAAAVTEASGTTSPGEANDVIVDPNTGVKFVLAKTFSGANNVIKFGTKLILSPDARFLVSIDGLVVPLDGTSAFRCTERRGDVRDRAVSPDGRYIAHGEKAVWLQPVSPETLRPNGPAKKLLDLRGGQLVGRNYGKALHWTRDSQTVFFAAHDAEGRSHPYAFSAATGAPVSLPDAAATGLLSPDGRCVALTLLTDVRRGSGFWVKPIGGGAARMLCEQETFPMCWSQDGRWLIGAQIGEVVRFVRYPEGQEYLVSLPKELAHDSDDYSGTYCVGPSADASRLFFYQTGYTVKWRIKVASAEGAALRDLDSDVRYAFRAFQWARDGKATFQTDYQVYPMQPETALRMSPLSGDKPVPFALMPAVSARATPLAVSPDSKWLLFTPAQESGSRTLDLNVIPLSMADHGVSGPATVVFRMTPPAQGSSYPSVWSPDSTRVALTCKADPVDEQDIWVVFTDGRTPIRLTRTTAIERHLKWSPDGNMLAFLSDDAGVQELKVVPTAGGEAAVIRKWAVAGVPAWGWSPDGKSLTIAEEDTLVRQPLSGGKAEPIVNLKEYGIEGLEWQGWSPDGSRLALAYRERNTEDPLASSRYLLFARVEGGRLQQTAKVGADGGNMYYAWSPDSTHVAYLCEDAVPVRPAGRLYAVAVDDVVERIEAGAIPPTRPKAAEPAVTENPSESAPQPEPITGPVFSDNFDNGLSKYWQIVPLNNPKVSPPPAHAVENGQLMLLNSSACLNQIDWADYLVTVRVCVKEGVASGRGGVYIFTRATPSNFGIKDVDQYAFVVYTAPTSSLWLGLHYRNASGVRYGAALGTTPCTLVQGKWYKLAFEIRGEQLRAYLDDKLVIETTDARLSKGPVSISAARSPVLFDDFSVRRLP